MNLRGESGTLVVPMFGPDYLEVWVLPAESLYTVGVQGTAELLKVSPQAFYHPDSFLLLSFDIPAKR